MKYLLKLKFYINRLIKSLFVLFSSSFIYLNEKDPLKLVIKESISTPISMPLPKKDMVQGIFVRDGLGSLREASVKEVLSNLTTSQCISATILTLSVCYVGYTVYKFNNFGPTKPMYDIHTFGNIEYLKFKLGFKNKNSNLSSVQPEPAESINLPTESYFTKFYNIFFTFFKKLGKNLMNRHSYTNDKETLYNPNWYYTYHNNGNFFRLEHTHFLYKLYKKLIEFYYKNLCYYGFESKIVKHSQEKYVLTRLFEIKFNLCNHSDKVLDLNNKIFIIGKTSDKTLYDFYFNKLQVLKMENTNIYNRILECQQYSSDISLKVEKSLSILEGQVYLCRDMLHDLKNQIHKIVPEQEIQSFFDIDANDILNINQQILPIVPVEDLNIINQNVNFQKPENLKENLFKLDSIIIDSIKKKKIELKDSELNKIVNLNKRDIDIEESIEVDSSQSSGLLVEEVVKETSSSSSSLIPSSIDHIQQLQQLEFIHEVINYLNTEPTSLVVTSLLVKFSIKLLNLSDEIITFDSFKENFNGNLETLNTHIESLGQFLKSMWVGMDNNEDNNEEKSNEVNNSKSDDDDNSTK